jgi:acylphosphatase
VRFRTVHKQLGPKKGNWAIGNPILTDKEWCMEITATHLIIHGKVQGVFYRDWTVETARSLGVTGWVRNLPDGTVEAYLEGDAQTMERMIASMHDGPPRAAPARIDTREVAGCGFTRFERR